MFKIDSGVRASISGATITGGSTTTYPLGDGGAGLFNEGTLTLTGCTISGNTSGTSSFTGYPSGGPGGGVYSSGTLTLTDCTVSGNSSGGFEGGGLAIRGGTAKLTDCTVANNSLAGITTTASSTLSLIGCTLASNSSRFPFGGRSPAPASRITARPRWSIAPSPATTSSACSTAGR